MDPRPLFAGRQFSSEESRPFAQRVEFLSASLDADRLDAASSYPYQRGATANALLDNLEQSLTQLANSTKDKNSGKPQWNKVAFLCETNKQLRSISVALRKRGIPVVTLASKEQRVSDVPTFGFLRAAFILLKANLQPLTNGELFELLVSPLACLSFNQVAALFKLAQEKASELFFAPPELRNSIVPRADTLEIFATLFSKTLDPLRMVKNQQQPCPTTGNCLPDSTAALSNANWFSVQRWQLMCQSLIGPEKSREAQLFDEVCSAVLKWENKRFRINSYQELPTKLSHWKFANLAINTAIESANAVQLLTVHGAKGLEWDSVYFMPRKEKIHRGAEFVISSVNSVPVLKWLGGDTTSLGLLPWVDIGKAEDFQHTSKDAKKGKEKVDFFIDLQQKLEELFERQRVFYTALTRAKEKLVLVQPMPAGNVRKSLRDKLAKLPVEDCGNYRKAGVTSFEELVFAGFLDAYFETGYRKVCKKEKIYAEPWAHSGNNIVSQRNANVSWTENNTVGAPDEGIVTEIENALGSSVETKSTLRVPSQPPDTHNLSTMELWDYWNNDIPSGLLPALKNSSRKTQGQYYQRRMRASEGVAYHALQELMGHKATSPGAQFVKISTKHWFELEVWHSPSSSFSQLTCEDLRRNIIDLLCYVPADQLSESLLGKKTKEKLSGLIKSKFCEVAIVLDYKTGQPKESHNTQLKSYLQVVSSLRNTGFGCAPEASPLVLGAICYDMHKLRESKNYERLLEESPFAVLLFERYFVTYSFLTTP